jgi:hypothetical protein
MSDTNVANVLIAYYNQDGTQPIADVSDSLPPGYSATYFPIDAPAGFNGSVVVSSDQPVAAIVNVLGNGLNYGASYGGFSAGAAEVNLPLIMKGNSGFNTWFNVQNTGTASASVNISYAGTACTETATIPAGAAATFDQSTNSCLTAGYVGAATITSADGTVAATAMEVGPTTLFAYNGFTSGSTNPAIPLVNANNSGYITGLQIQNAGGTSTDVTVTYTPSVAGTTCTEMKTIPAGASATFALYSFSFNGDPDPGTDNCAFGTTFVGSATVTTNSAGNDLIAIVNQLNLGANKGSAYAAFDPAQASATVVMPLIMDRNSGFFTGISIVNLGATTTVTCEYSDGTNTYTETSGALASGEGFNSLQLNALNAGFVGSAICTANTAGGLLLGQVNELNQTLPGDLLFTYEAFNK